MIRRCSYLANLGVANSTGTFKLIPLDQRLPFVDGTPPTCRNAAELLDGILALAITRHDDEQRLRYYAETITREVTRWDSA